MTRYQTQPPVADIDSVATKLPVPLSWPMLPLGQIFHHDRGSPWERVEEWPDLQQCGPSQRDIYHNASKPVKQNVAHLPMSVSGASDSLGAMSGSLPGRMAGVETAVRSGTLDVTATKSSSVPRSAISRKNGKRSFKPCLRMWLPPLRPRLDALRPWLDALRPWLCAGKPIFFLQFGHLL